MKSNKKKRLNVLLIDDEEAILNLNELVLKDHYNVFKALNLKEASAILNNHSIEIIVSDHFLGSENGLNFLVNSHEQFPLAVKIILSSCICHEVILQSHNSKSIFRYLTKPCTNEDLLENINLAAITYEISIIEGQQKEEHFKLKESLDEIDLIELKKERKSKSILELFRVSSKSVFYLGVGILGTGIIALLLLYCLKSLLGFDIFQ